MKAAHTHKIKIEVDNSVAGCLATLMKLANHESFGEVVITSLAFYQLALEHREKGGTLVFMHKDGRSEIFNPKQ